MATMYIPAIESQSQSPMLSMLCTLPYTHSYFSHGCISHMTKHTAKKGAETSRHESQRQNGPKFSVANGISQITPVTMKRYSLSPMPSAALLFLSTLYNAHINLQTHQTHDHIASKAICHQIKPHRVRTALVHT